MQRHATMYGPPGLIEQISALHQGLNGAGRKFNGIRINSMVFSTKKRKAYPSECQITIRSSQEGRTFYFSGYVSPEFVSAVQAESGGIGCVSLAGEKLAKKLRPSMRSHHLYSIMVELF